MSKTVTAFSHGNGSQGGFALHSANGERKYLNRHERNRALASMVRLAPAHSLFALVLAWTGARVSEVLALTPQSFELESGLVSIMTLKRRGQRHARQVPIPPDLMRLLDRYFSLRALQANDSQRCKRLWPFCRMTAWRIVRRVMTCAGIIGKRACPRGLRHSFGVTTLGSGAPQTLVQRWMGHARLSTTAIYTNVCGPEEIAFARHFWRTSERRK
jgi:site-specific recombinase XerD